MILLPFKGKLIYDGIIYSRNISFGSSITKSFTSDFNLAKAKHGLITTLPHKETDNSDRELLKFYVKNETNREYYEEEILALISKSEELKIAYYQELGKATSRHFTKSLRSVGVVSNANELRKYGKMTS